MAVKRVMISDITGPEADESKFVTMIVRDHPAISEAKALDVLPDEVKSLKNAGNLVTLEIGVEGGEKKTVVVTLAEFRKLVSDEAVQAARVTRGRRAGWSPRS